MAWSRAPSHSRVVRWLKIGLPLVALASLSAIFLIPRQSGGLDIDRLYTTADIVAIGQGLEVSNPSFSGETENGEPFQIRALLARPDKPDPDLVDLVDVAGQIRMKDGRDVTLTAATGALRPKSDRLSLEGGVVLKTSDGYEARAEVATANVKTRTLSTPGALKVEGPRGSITSGAFRAERRDEGGDIFYFENRVKVVYIPASETGSEAGSGAGPGSD